MALLLLAFSLLFFALASTYVNASVINVKTASPSADIQVDQVSHTIKIRDSGLVSINDTLKLSSKDENVVLQNFSIGFPFKYGAKLDYCFAYDASNPDERFNVTLDAGLGERIGFYGVNVVFPEPGVNIVKNESYNLTLVFVFSNLVSYEIITLYNVDFPMYPSLVQNASVCDVAVILPPRANCTNSTFHERGLNFNIITLNDTQILKHTKGPLDSFSYEPAWLTFNVNEHPPTYVFFLIDVHEVKREIKLDQWGGIQLSDSYYITNRRDRISNIRLVLPEGAYDISPRDEFGDLGKLLEEGGVRIYFREKDGVLGLEKDVEGKFTVTYRLPWKKYVNQHNWRDYNLAFNFLEQFNWTIRKLTVTITLPEGAELQSSKPLDPYNIEKSVFQETITYAFSNVTPFHDLDFDLTYRYMVFWASFYPALWMGILVMVASAIALIWRAPKPPPIPITLAPPEDLRSFVEAYEGKTGILLELESMEEQLRKGRIPRRRYKVRKKMLESRLSTLSRDLTNLRGKIRAAGERYASIMRQIEVAETMLEGVETDIRRVEARYRRGEISKGAYGRLLQEYHRRRERAKTTIDEVLLRLREEIR